MNTTYQILTNDDEVCIPSLSSIFIAVLGMYNFDSGDQNVPCHLPIIKTDNFLIYLHVCREHESCIFVTQLTDIAH